MYGWILACDYYEGGANHAARKAQEPGPTASVLRIRRLLLFGHGTMQGWRAVSPDCKVDLL